MRSNMSIVYIVLAVVGGLTAIGAISKLAEPTTPVKPTGVEPYVYDVFQTWSAKNGRAYGSEDEKNYRLLIFRDNYFKIKANIESNKTFTLAMNQFTDMTNEEFKAKYLGYKPAQQKNVTMRTTVRLPTDSLPAAVNWVESGIVAPVKDQGQCGSCWAFSTIAAVEGLHAQAAGQIVTYSEQELVDCSKAQGNEGCNGGLMDYGFQYIVSNGIEAEADYKYTAKDQKCKAVKTKAAYKIAGFADVPAGDNDQLKAAVAKGVVSVAIEADTEVFQFYSKGVITGDSCGTQLDHGVAAVGYGTEAGQDYWLVRNSWGSSWGSSGYVKIGRNAGSGNGVCGIAMSASYPTA